MAEAITPVEWYERGRGLNPGGWWAKREDIAGRTTPETMPSGAKVRQYAAMAAERPGAPMIVGCSSHSAMQIYVAAAALTAGVPAIVYVPHRARFTDATRYALALGAEIHTVRPGHLSVCRARARADRRYPEAVRWDVRRAVLDTAEQCANVPPEAARVVVPTGSGLTAAGVLVGLARRGMYRTPVVAVCVSRMASANGIWNTAQAHEPGREEWPELRVEYAPGKYNEWVAACLPDGTPLDPFYAAKVVPQPGDCFWVPGVRAWCAMPADCIAALWD